MCYRFFTGVTHSAGSDKIQETHSIVQRRENGTSAHGWRITDITGMGIATRCRESWADWGAGRVASARRNQHFGPTVGIRRRADEIVIEG